MPSNGQEHAGIGTTISPRSLRSDIIAAVHGNPDLAPQEDEQKMNAVVKNLSRDLAAVDAPMPRFIRAPEAAANENDAVSANVTTDSSLDDVNDERE